MGAVTVGDPLRPALVLTPHPLQRCGAWAATILAGKPQPGDLSQEDLDAVAHRLIEDIVAVSSRPKSAPSPDWWKVLFALYPNAKATHATRARDAATLRPLVARLFAPDDSEAPEAPKSPDGSASGRFACTFCSTPTSVLWAKSHLPLFDTTKALNTLPPATAGWPVCQGCRVALWALPYGAWVTAGSATVLMCENQAVERRFAQRNVTRARRIQQLGFAGVPADAAAETITLAALRAHAADAPADAVLWSFKNDNQEPWLRVTATRLATGRFLGRVAADPETRRGWNRLRRALAHRDRESRGYAAIARTLFGGELTSTDPLLRALYQEFKDPPADPATVAGWRALAWAYQEEIYGMDVERLTPARRLVADWIMAERNPRGRFNEYAKVAGHAYNLHRLLMAASARLLRDGGQPPDITGVAPALLSGGQDGWRLRAQLFFEVVAELVAAKAPIGGKSGDDEDEDDIDLLRLDPTEEEVYA